MEEAIRKELNQLCREIISNPAEGDLNQLLNKLRLLEEKLVLLQYFNYRAGQYQDSQKTEQDYDREVEEALKAAEMSQSQAQQMSSGVRLADTPGQQPVRAEVPSEEKTTASPAEQKPTEAPVEKKQLQKDQPPKEAEQAPQREREAPLSKQRSINESYLGGQIKLGLNDRIAFSKHLFDGSQEDLNRVISQINTFGSYSEAEGFIEEMVKPDYDWSDKEEYEERFLELVKAKFGEE